MQDTYIWYLEEIRVEAVHVHEAHDARDERDNLPQVERAEQEEEKKCESREPSPHSKTKSWIMQIMAHTSPHIDRPQRPTIWLLPPAVYANS